MNTPTVAGDEIARRVDALDRKIDTLSSQLQSLLDRASQGPSAPLPVIPRKPQNTKQMAPLSSDSFPHAPTVSFAPPTVTRAHPIGRTTDATVAAPQLHSPIPSRERPIMSQAPVRALSAPPTTYPSAEQVNSGSRPIPKEEDVARTRRRAEASRRLEEGRQSRLAVAGLSESPPQPMIAQGLNPTAKAGQRGRTVTFGLPESLNAVDAGPVLPRSATTPPDIAQSPTRSRCTLSIPDDVAGHIIGRDGHGLRLATEISGALLSIAKSTIGSRDPRIATIRGTNEQIGKALVVMGKRIAQERVPNPRHRRPTSATKVDTHDDSVEVIAAFAGYKDTLEGESTPLFRIQESHREPAAEATTSLSGEIPSGSEYRPERMDICTANLETTIATPPRATATVAETLAYCEELEAQTRIVEAEVRLLKLACAPTTSFGRAATRRVDRTTATRPTPVGPADVTALWAASIAMVQTQMPNHHDDATRTTPFETQGPVTATTTPDTCNAHATTPCPHPVLPVAPELQHPLPVAGSALAKLAVTPPPSGSALLRTGVSAPTTVAPTSKESLRSHGPPAPLPAHDVPGPTKPTKSATATVDPASTPTTVPLSATLLTPAQNRRAAAKVRKQAVAAKQSPTAPTTSAKPISDPTQMQSQPVAVAAPTSTSSETTSGKATDVAEAPHSEDTSKAARKVASKARKAAAALEDIQNCPKEFTVRDSRGKEIRFSLDSPWHVNRLLADRRRAPQDPIARRNLAWKILRSSDAESRNLVEQWTWTQA